MNLKRLLIIPLLFAVSISVAQDRCSKISLHGVQGSAFGVYKKAVEYKVIQMEGIYSKSLDLYLSYYPIIDEGELYVNFDVDGTSPFSLMNKVVISSSTGLKQELKLSQFIIDGTSTNQWQEAGKRVSLRAKVSAEDLALLAGDRIVKVEFAGKTFDLLNLWGEEFQEIAQCVTILAMQTDKEFNDYKAYEHLKRPKSERMFHQTESGYISANGKSINQARQHGIGIEY